jgi:hypothetical protein
MSKAILEFNLPEDREEFELASNAGSMHSSLWQISQEVFRPARKHGYADPVLAEIVKQHPEYAEELIMALEQKFFQILEENGVEL